MHQMTDHAAERSAPEWLTVAAAAEYVGVSIGSMRNYERRGLVSARRTPGGHRRYNRADLAGLLVEGGVAQNSGQHPVSSAPSGDADSRERLDRPATFGIVQ